jgi:hypothetical protein
MSHFNLEQRWAEFLKGRAQRLRTTEQEAARIVPSPYLSAIKEKAERLGISAEEVKRRHRDLPHSYPTPECIRPTELAEFVDGEEPSEAMLSHLQQCEPCWALLNMANPSEDRLKSLLEEVRIRVGERAARSEPVLTDLFDVPTLDAE